jgi:glutamyl-tRNA synthetase
VITRFAPSPTGFLHLGNIRTALIAYFHVKSSGGEFILRIDDTDTARVSEEYINQILEDLNWLGVKHDQFFKQSDRFDRYKEVLNQLIEAGRAYHCYETPEELEFKRKSLLKRGLPPIYDREGLRNQNNKVVGRKPYYRFKLDYNHVVSWNDKIRGEITINLQSTSDPIILRENGLYTYMLPSVVDDIDYKINTVVRGEDHITNTAVQIQMLNAIGSKIIPDFIHLPLLKAQEAKISKRNRGYEIKSLRDDNIELEVIVNYLMNLGNANLFEINNKKILSDFNISNYSSSAVTLNVDDIVSLNSKFLYQSSFEEFKNRLAKKIDENFWETIKGNINRRTDVDYWWEICNTDIVIEKLIENKEIIEHAILTFPYDNTSAEKYKLWIEIISRDMDCKKSEVSINLRLALTGMRKGPEIAKLLILINDEFIIKRLKAQLNDI